MHTRLPGVLPPGPPMAEVASKVNIKAIAGNQENEVKEIERARKDRTEIRRQVRLRRPGVITTNKSILHVIPARGNCELSRWEYEGNVTEHNRNKTA